MIIIRLYQQAPSMDMVRRHARSNARFQFRPVVGAVTGNYVTAKRRGLLGGAQLGLTGKVRFVQVEELRQQLDAGNIVVMGVMGYSVTGVCWRCAGVCAGYERIDLHSWCTGADTFIVQRETLFAFR